MNNIIYLYFYREKSICYDCDLLKNHSNVFKSKYIKNE